MSNDKFFFPTGPIHPQEHDYILKAAVRKLNNATGKRPCDCRTPGTPAKGWADEKFNENCPDCERGWISNPDWDGTRDQFDALLVSIKAGSGGGTAYVFDGDRVGPGGLCSWLQVETKGLYLTRPEVPGEVEKGRKVGLTWNEIYRALSEPAVEQLELEMTA